ncbi:MAG: S8 family serine peptidase [Candidatus Hadarchaeales archaeon]
MFRDRLTPVAERLAHSRVVTPVIIETETKKFFDVFEETRPFLEEVVERLPRMLTEISPLGAFPYRIMRRFSMFAGILPREIVFDLAEDHRVKRIYDDRLVWAFQYPTVPPEGVFEFMRRPGKPMTFTSTFWTKRAIGADTANEKGFTGRGVLVSIVDTGGARVHEQIRRVEFETVIKAQHRDENGHGCVAPNSLIFTTKCGIETIENFYNALKAEYEEIASDLGWTIIPKEPIYTIGFDGKRTVKTKILMVHKIPIREKVIRVKSTGTTELLTTSWHPFLVYDYRRKSPKYVEASKLNPRVHAFVTPEFVELGNYKIDERLAYLIGLFIGDGHMFDKRHHYVLLAVGKKKARKIIRLIKELGYSYCLRKDGTIEVYGLWNELVGLGMPVDKKSGKIQIPKKILLSSKPTILAMLAGIVDSNGYFDKNRARIRIVTASPTLANQLVFLLSLFGMDARITDRKDIYCVSVVGESYFKFVRTIGPYLRIKTPRFNGKSRPHVHKWVISKKAEDYDGFFYDLTTETQNYLAGTGGCVFAHNTWCVATVGGVAGTDEYLSAKVGKKVVCEGIAPECGLLAIKALGYYIGSGSTSGIIQAIEMSIDRGAKVINMSLGSDDPPETSPDQDAFFPVFEECAKYGVIPVVANGNAGPDPGTVGSPGNMPNVLSVGAYDPITGEVAEFSSRGPTKWGDIKPDCIMPGVNTDSASVGVCDIAGDGKPTRYSPISGTCLAKDSLIYTPEGPIELKDLRRGDYVFSFDEKEKTTAVGECVDIIDRGVNEVFRLETFDGREIIATLNHPFLVSNGYDYLWIPLEKLGVHEWRVTVPKIVSRPEPTLDELVNIEVAKTLGYFLADGWVSRRKRNYMVCSAMDGDLSSLGISCKVNENKWKYAYSKRLVLALSLLGFGQWHKSIRLPRWCFHLSKEKRRNFSLPRIKEITRIGKEHVYDLTILPYSNFIVNGVVVHNSMATPHASGMVALMEDAYRRLLGKTLTLDEIKAMLEALQDHPKNNDAGWGVFSWQKVERWLETQYGIVI